MYLTVQRPRPAPLFSLHNWITLHPLTSRLKVRTVEVWGLKRSFHMWNIAFTCEILLSRVKYCFHAWNIAFTREILLSRVIYCFHAWYIAFTCEILLSRVKYCFHMWNIAFTLWRKLFFLWKCRMFADNFAIRANMPWVVYVLRCYSSQYWWSLQSCGIWHRVYWYPPQVRKEISCFSLQVATRAICYLSMNTASCAGKLDSTAAPDFPLKIETPIPSKHSAHTHTHTHTHTCNRPQGTKFWRDTSSS